ncbi:hypothetical protein [Nocardiopsis lambiniae]|uniref:Uncharacterized protein n=1 Tax=Nocardiopsis lambiniae TaxID=3075539 RepID=A0ABU2M5Y3_9ACTN|nr:hypothetical protein [Nocardiopsis sp. DSM 44743]MDT0328068.1 hypothetical protein [Nocardiopsis sp. DSM 44743]
MPKNKRETTDQTPHPRPGSHSPWPRITLFAIVVTTIIVLLLAGYDPFYAVGVPTVAGFIVDSLIRKWDR